MKNRRINHTTVCEETDRAHIAITLRCNNNCIFCLQGHHPDIGHRSFEEIKIEIDAARESGVTRIVISGGEPTIHPDYLRIVTYCKEIGFSYIQTVSNGRMFSSELFAQKVVNAGLTEITVSLHGKDAKTHDYLVAVPGAFNQLVKGVLNLKKLGIIISVDVGIFQQNYKQLLDIIRFIRNDLGLRGDIDLIGPTPQGNAEINLENVMPDYDSVQPYLREALKYCKNNNVVCWVLRVPLQYMEGYEIFKQDNHKLVEQSLSMESTLSSFPAKCEGYRCSYCRMKYVCDKLNAIYPKLSSNESETSLQLYIINTDTTPLKNFSNKHFERIISPVDVSVLQMLQTSNIHGDTLYLKTSKNISQNIYDVAKLCSKNVLISFSFVSFNQEIASLFSLNSNNLFSELSIASSKFPVHLQYFVTKQNLSSIEQHIEKFISHGVQSITLEFPSAYDLLSRGIDWKTGLTMKDENNLLFDVLSAESKLRTVIELANNHNCDISITNVSFCSFSENFLSSYSSILEQHAVFSAVPHTAYENTTFKFSEYVSFIYKNLYKERMLQCVNCTYSDRCAGFDPMLLKFKNQ
jgi:MoaA/NifB/PqqE/SkfB family radical SAM enzyme